ncbi:MAG TPA: hypothetical protein VL068_11910 [Microthrixaceae bacterium]|nr:hypothetical protein [Microthrixaceae bacterium]
MRAHAHVEDHIRRLKAFALEPFPFTIFVANEVWLTIAGFVADLTRWFQLLYLTGLLSKAELKT